MGDLKCEQKSTLVCDDSKTSCGQKCIYDLLVKNKGNFTVVNKAGNTIFHIASLYGIWQTVEYMLEAEPKIVSIDTKGQYGRTAVMMAAHHGHIRVFHSLVDRGCNLSLKDDDGDSVLHMACMSGNLDIVKYLLSRDDIDLDKRGKYGDTAVMVAALNGHRKSFDLLVSKGCMLSLQSENGDTILHMACIGGNTSITKKLLDKSEEHINGRGQHGKTPVMVAAEKGDIEMFNVLVEHDCDLSIRDDDNNSVLHVACFAGNATLVKQIISRRYFGVDVRGYLGRTAAMIAVAQGQREVFDVLIEEGCDLSLEDENGLTAVHYACIYQNVDFVDYVLSHEFVMDHKNSNSETPLATAARFGNWEVCKNLILRGWDVNVNDCYGNSVFMLAYIGGCMDIVESLLRNDRLNRCTILLHASTEGHNDVVDLLLERDSYNTLYGFKLGHDLDVLDRISVANP